MPTTIVVVDEHPAFVNQVKALVTEAGYRVVGCVGHYEAVRAFEHLRDAVDLAIIDFLVPGTTGPELIGTIKRQMPGLKIIATVPGEGPDLTPLVSKTDADLVFRRPKIGELLDRSKWIPVVERMLGQANAAS